MDGGEGELVGASEDDRVDEASHASQQRAGSTVEGTTSTTARINADKSRQPIHVVKLNPPLPQSDSGGPSAPRFRPNEKYARKRSETPTPTVGVQPTPAEGVWLGQGETGVTERASPSGPEECQPRNIEGAHPARGDGGGSGSGSGSGAGEVPSGTAAGSAFSGPSSRRRPVYKPIPVALHPRNDRGGKSAPRFRPIKRARKRSRTPTPTGGAQSAPAASVRHSQVETGVVERAPPSRQESQLRLEGAAPPARGGGGGSGSGGDGVSSFSARGAIRTGGGNGKSKSRPSSRGRWSRSWVSIDTAAESASTARSSNAEREPATANEREESDVHQDQETTGPIPWLKVITVALEQAEENGVWYTSAQELTLVSLGSCIACRTVPIVRLRVDDDTPLELFVDVHTLKREGYKPTKTRVPSILYSALRELTWLLPVWGLSRFAEEVLARVEVLTAIDCYNHSIANVMFPPHLKILRLEGLLNRTIKEVSFPGGLQELELGGKFNRSLDHAQLPQSLKRLTLGPRFDSSIEKAKFPADLQYLSFGNRFNNGGIARVSRLTNLQELSLGFYFNQPINGISWPPSLKKLEFGFKFNQAVDRVSWPGIEELTLFRPGAAAEQPAIPGVEVSGVPG